MTIPLQHLRLPALALTCALAGVPIGRTLRHALFPAATAAATRKPADSLPEDALENAMSRLLAVPPKDASAQTTQDRLNALALAQTEQSDLRRLLKVYNAVNALKPDEISAALKQELENGDSIAINALERRWAETDPENAAKLWFEKKQELGTAFFSAWARSNPISALRWYSSLRLREKSDPVLRSLLEQAAKTDPQTTLDFANQIGEEDRGSIRDLLTHLAFAQMSKEDVESALAAAKTLPSDSARGEALSSIIRHLASKDPSRSLQLLDEVSPNTVEHLDHIVGDIAKSDPQKTAQWANALPAGKSKNEAYVGIASAWSVKILSERSDKNVTDAAQWLDNLPKNAARDEAAGVFAINMSSIDPAVAAEWADTLPEGFRKRQAYWWIAQNWSAQNVETAALWADTLPNGRSKELAYREIADSWAYRNPAEATRWLDSLPQGAVRNEAVAAFSKRTALKDPEASAAWALTLPAGGQRTETLSETLKAWKLVNPASASDWIANAPNLSPEEKNTLLQTKPMSGDYYLKRSDLEAQMLMDGMKRDARRVMQGW